jgi:hypothetical protein
VDGDAGASGYDARLGVSPALALAKRNRAAAPPTAGHSRREQGEARMSDGPFNAERALREEYWLHHGCGGFSALYADDGEMQCRACGHDFKRESIEALAGFVAMNRVVRARERLGKFVQSVERLEQVVKQEQGVRS